MNTLHNLFRLVFFSILTSIIFASPVLPASGKTAAENSIMPVSPAASGRGLSDSRELESFLDGIITAQLTAYRIPGATIAVVKDGSLFFAKGYGYANVEANIPVVADQTLFYPGSVSKLFTWTAVMQLVEQGKLDLNTDINTYLKTFQVPDTYPQPITLAHLMTHTSGFDIQELGVYVNRVENIMPLGEYVTKHLPARVRAPGEIVAYSNYGTALAGYIIEQVAGMPYEQYIEINIFSPLGMTRSTFRQPLPPELRGDMAAGYDAVDGAFKAKSEWVQIAPAGGLSSTSTDMAEFMIAHLQDGCNAHGCILGAETAQAMHRNAFTSDPRASGWAYGFEEMALNGQRLIWHGGTTNYYHSTLVLLPEHNVGLFVSYNSPGGLPAWQALIRDFMDRYYPGPAKLAPQLSANSSQPVSRYTGTYLESKCSRKTPEALFSLIFPITVQEAGAGILSIKGYGYGMNSQEVSLWEEVEPMFFRSLDGKDALVFHADSKGRITEMIPVNNPTSIYIRQPWYGDATLHLFVLVGSLLFFLSGILAFPIAFIGRRRKISSKDPSRPLLSLARWLAWIFCSLSLSFIVAFFLMMSNPEILYGLPPAMMPLLAIPPVIALLGLGLVIFTGLAWIKRFWGVIGRLHYTLITLSALAFIWWLYYWHVLGAFAVYW